MALDDFSSGSGDKSQSNESEEVEAERIAEEFEDYEDVVDLVEGTFLRWAEGDSMAPVLYDKESNTITAIKDHMVVGVAAMIIKFNEEHQRVYGTDDSDDESDDSDSDKFDLSDLPDR